MKKVLLLLVLISIFSCQDKSKLSYSEEAKIFEDVLPKVLDTISLQVLPIPKTDSGVTINKKEKMLIIVNDSTESIDIYDQKAFCKYYKDISIEIDSSSTKLHGNIYKFKNVNAHKLNLKLKSNTLTFKLASKKELKTLLSYPNYFCSHIGISYLKLDNSGKYGLFSISNRCCGGTDCGEGYRVYIKKINYKWVIDAIIPTWVT